jgi:hypothetical protein
VLYMAALVAKRYNPLIAAFVKRLVAKKPKRYSCRLHAQTAGHPQRHGARWAALEIRWPTRRQSGRLIRRSAERRRHRVPTAWLP